MTVDLDAAAHSGHYLILAIGCGWHSLFFINQNFIAQTTVAALGRGLTLEQRLGEFIIGQDTSVERIPVGFLANGNLLAEGLPGLAETRAIEALAKSLEADFSRVHFAPDSLPSVVTGTELYHSRGGSGEFRFEQCARA